MDFYPALKAVSMVATGVFGVIGVLTDYKDAKDRVTTWGKIAIIGILISATLSLALYAMEASRATEAGEEAKTQYDETQIKLSRSLLASRRLLGLQQTSLHNSESLEAKLAEAVERLDGIKKKSEEMARKQAITLTVQRRLVSTGEHLQFWQIRTSLPLMPLTVRFQRSFQMDLPSLEGYTRRLSKLLSDPNSRRQIIVTVDVYGHTVGLLKGELLPQIGVEAERRAYFELLNGRTLFTFSSPRTGPVFTFVCMPKNEDTLVADLTDKAIVDTVACGDLEVSGQSAAISSIDLVGQRLTWHGNTNAPSFKIRWIALTFPYNRSREVYLNVRDGESGVDLSAKALELNRIVSFPVLPPAPP